MCEEKIYHPVDDNKSTKMLNDLIIKKFIANYKNFHANFPLHIWYNGYQKTVLTPHNVYPRLQ